MKAFALLRAHDKAYPVELTSRLFASQDNHCDVGNDLNKRSKLNQSARIAFESVLDFFSHIALLGARKPLGLKIFFDTEIKPEFDIKGTSAGLIFALLSAGKVYEYFSKKNINVIVAATGVVKAPEAQNRLGKVDDLEDKLHAALRIPTLLQNEGLDGIKKVKVFYPSATVQGEKVDAPNAAGFEFIAVETVEQAIADLLGVVLDRPGRRPWLTYIVASLLLFLLPSHQPVIMKPKSASEPPGAAGYINKYRRGTTPPLYTERVKLKGIDSTDNISPLVLASDDTVDIWLDGQLLATEVADSLVTAVSQGTHFVNFEHPEYGSAEFKITITDSRRQKYICNYKRSIMITSSLESGQPFSAQIFVDGVSIKRDSNYRPILLKPGVHKITVNSHDHITLEGIKRYEVLPALNKNEDTLSFTLRPTGK